MNPSPDFMRFMQAMYKSFQEGAKHDPTGDPVGGLYQEGGIFTYPFAGGPVFSAVQQPRTFLSVLPFRESRVENEVTEILTGMTDASGEHPSLRLPSTAAHAGQSLWRRHPHRERLSDTSAPGH